MKTLQDIKDVIEKHNKYRRSCLNLVGSEKQTSPSVKGFLTTDLGNRYATYNDNVWERNYLGVKYIAELEGKTHELAKEVYNAKYVDLRPLSGELAGKAVIMGLTEPGDVILEHGPAYGGHGVARRLLNGNLTREVYQLEYIPNDPETYDVDLERLEEWAKELKPKVISCGRAKPLFFESLEEVREIADKVGAYLVYDGAHIMGLVAGKAYPNPLEHGAQVFFGCTRKTLPAVQGGMILTNDENLLRQIRPSLYPSLQTNHDYSRVPALAATFLEMLAFGEEYMSQVVSNAQALGSQLESKGLAPLYPEKGYTRCHQVLLDVREQGDSTTLAKDLESAHIICGDTNIPCDAAPLEIGAGPLKPTGKSGIRMGVQEITRMGMKEPEMNEVANLIKQVLIDKEVDDIRDAVSDFVEGFQNIHYSFDEGRKMF